MYYSHQMAEEQIAPQNALVRFLGMEKIGILNQPPGLV